MIQQGTALLGAGIQLEVGHWKCDLHGWIPVPGSLFLSFLDKQLSSVRSFHHTVSTLEPPNFTQKPLENMNQTKLFSCELLSIRNFVLVMEKLVIQKSGVRIGVTIDILPLCFRRFLELVAGKVQKYLEKPGRKDLRCYELSFMNDCGLCLADQDADKHGDSKMRFRRIHL